jgi:hypothetical protein
MNRSHFGHFALTEALLPLLKKTAQEEGSDIRIVNVRLPHYMAAINIDSHP